MKDHKQAILIAAGNMAAILAALWIARRMRAADRLRYVEPGRPDSWEGADPEALLTDVGRSIRPENAWH